jgi:hypothetical protein
VPPIITSIVPMTELEAVNIMLGALGEAPLAAGTDLSTATQADVVKALGILRNATRECQAMGWKFNTEFSYEIAPSDTYSWVDTAGETTELNIFLPPTGLLGFSVSAVEGQTGMRTVDVEIGISREYTTGAPAAAVLVFRDRRRGRDGLPSSEHEYLYINPVWGVNFEYMPETARNYVAKAAARELVQKALGSETLAQFALRDEARALRSLKIDQGLTDDYNLLQTWDVRSARGRRPGGWSGWQDTRKNRGSV